MTRLCSRGSKTAGLNSLSLVEFVSSIMALRWPHSTWTSAVLLARKMSGGLNPPDIFLAKRTADVQVECGQRSAMIDDTNSTNDNEFKPAVFEPREQSLVILRHEIDQLLEPPIKNQ